ncbi:hypothetical protein [Helicobacter sp. 10-6591]|uniref:hypothetical protein n=1 Tax=Helicobacter sp. 10-6591 TaxID=2004998 RepID=UPI000DCDCFE8|nr:hypothetical protein [Helicobacter sp. 10-6591]RAX52978.1 hypothetical protein CCY97_07385 [Helicobacter sp. 10-6591]
MSIYQKAFLGILISIIGGGIYFNATLPTQTDDVWMFFRIFDNQPIFDGYNPSAGRFFPLAFLDLNILMQFSSSPKLFFFFNALEFVFMALVVCVLSLKMWGNNFKITLATLFVVFINIGFVTVITGICYPERMQMLFLCIFILSLYFAQKPEANILWFIVCFVSASISIFYKETDFIFIGGFGALYLLFRFYETKSLKQTFDRNGYLALSRVVVALCFIFIYLIFIYPQMQGKVIEQAESFVLHIRDVINVFLTHSFIFLLIPYILFLRIKDFYITKVLYPLYDSLLISALVGGFSYFVLGRSSPYYFMPCYIIALLPILFFAKMYFLRLKIVLMVVFAMHCFLNVPLALSKYTQAKMLPPSYAKAMEFMADYTHTTQEKPAIFLLGQNRDPDGLMLYGFVKDFLQYYGAKDFDLQTNKSNPDGFESIQSPFSIFGSSRVDIPKKGDLLYLDSFSKDYIDEAYLNALNQNYQLVFESSYFGVYNITPKSIAKYLLQHSKAYAAYQNQPRVSANIFNAPLSVRIYQVR